MSGARVRVAHVPTTLVAGASAAARERAIAELLARPLAGGGAATAQVVILEGLPSGTSPLDSLEDTVHVARIAPGCLCCTGNLVLRVTLNRLLRQGPERLFIGLARGEHLDQLRSWLLSEPYDQLLLLTEDVQAC